MVKSKGIRLYNVLVDNGEYQLNVEELYLYGLLRRLINYNAETVISIGGIEEYSRKYNEVKFYGKVSEARRRVKESLLLLQEKKLITLDNEPKEYGSLVRVTFQENLGGYEYIPFSLFDSLNNMCHLYIYFAIAKWKGSKEGTFNCTRNGWGDILNISPVTVDKYIEQCMDSGLIYRSESTYTAEQARSGQKKREVYKYKITPFATKPELEETQIVVKADTDNKYGFSTGNWLGDGNLTVDDYIIYLKQKLEHTSISKDFIADCDRKRMRINKSGKFKHVEDKLIEQARFKLQKIKEESQLREKKQEERKIIDVIRDGKVVVQRLVKQDADNPFMNEYEDVVLDSVEQLDMDDTMYYLQHDGYEEKLFSVTMLELVTGNDPNNPYETYEYSDEVKSEILGKLKVVLSELDSFDIYATNKQMATIRLETVNLHNSARKADEDWEGDMWHEDIDMLAHNTSRMKRVNDLVTNK